MTVVSSIILDLLNPVFLEHRNVFKMISCHVTYLINSRQLDEAISVKEVQFTEIRSQLANSETRNKELEARRSELEQTVARLQQEIESME